MEIIRNVRIVDLALYLVKEKALVISDVHLGLEEAMNKQGYLIPRSQFKDVRRRLERIFSENNVELVVFNGDLKHEFGSISRTEWKGIFEILEFVGSYCKNIILIKGNHDILLEPIARKLNIEVQNYCKVNGYLILHGDKLIGNDDFNKADIVIIGNEHTAVSLRKSGRREIYKCFLVGKYKNKKLIAMPSFNTLVEGSDVLREELQSPMLQQDLRNFDVYIVADKTYKFGKVKDVEKL